MATPSKRDQNSKRELHTFALPPEQWKWLCKEAEKRDQSASAVMRAVVAEAMNKG